MIKTFLFLISSFSLANFFSGKTEIEKPFQLRDPFLAPKMSGGKFIKSPRKVLNKYDLENLKLSDIKLSGIFIGENRSVVLRTKFGNKTIALKEGDKIDDGKVELKAIMPFGIVFLEKIKNIYDDFEYTETVISIKK